MTFLQRDSKDQLNSFSKQTTCVASPSDKRDSNDAVSNLMRNSDYYNSTMKRVEMEYRKFMATKARKSSHANK